MMYVGMPDPSQMPQQVMLPPQEMRPHPEMVIDVGCWGATEHKTGLRKASDPKVPN